MSTPSISKLRFFAVYLLSVGFVVILVTLLMGMKNPVEQPASNLNTGDDEVWTANQYLHGRVAQLNVLYAAALQDPTHRFQNAAALQKAEAAFTVSVDSVLRTSTAKENIAQSAWEQMANAFRQGVEARKTLLQAYQNQPESPASNSTGNTQQLTELQQQVQQRDATIAELNQRLSARPATTNNGQADAELSRVNATLRSSVEKLRTENESLNRSYKAVVDDHKRVLAQLQSARKP